MTAAPQAPTDTRRRGWCPGALRPMASGDGLLVRIKPSCGCLTLDQADAIAALAATHGNGMIELTSRGNLQLRGVRDETLAPLTSALDRLGLLDASAEAEAVRNVIGSPLAGLDVAAYDTRPLVRALEARLSDDATLHALSDKFLFVIDGGGARPLNDVEADICFAWRDDAFAIGLGREAGFHWIGTCAAEHVVDIAVTLAHAFITHARARRMRLLDHEAIEALIPSPRPYGERVRVRGSVRTAPDGGTPTPAAASSIDYSQNLPLTPTLSPSSVGTGSGGASPTVIEIALAYGATTAAALAALLREARAAGAGEVRLTPWRALIVPVTHDATSLIAQASRLGFVTTAQDPRHGIAACPGAPACANGSTPVRDDADRFAAAAASLLAAGATLHVSGCAKGCARRRPATVTLVAEAGTYGVVVNATAAAAPAARYTAAEAAETLARLASAMTKAGDSAELCSAAAIEAALEEIEAA